MWGLETDIHASDISYEMHYCGQDCEGYRGPQSPSLETDACLTSHHALIAMHLTAPLEATLTVLLHAESLLAGASTTTEEIAASHPRCRAVTEAASRSQRTRTAVCRAEVRRLRRVKKIVPARRLDVVTHGNEASSVIAAHDFKGTVKTVLESVAHVTKGWHLAPARTERARSRKPVAFALQKHEVAHRLVHTPQPQ